MPSTIQGYLSLCNKELKHPNNNSVMEYLRDRFLTEDYIDSFGIGYSPCEWSITNEDKMFSKFFDEFPRTKRNLTKRLVFPIKNYKGDLSGFITRTIGDPKFYRKFLFYPHIPFYNMYGINENLGHIEESKSVFVVESIFDLVAVYPWVKNCVALLGTAFLDSQMSVLKRFSDHVYLGFNNDFDSPHQAGNEATKYAKKRLKKFGFRVTHVKLPERINDFSDLRSEMEDLGDFLGNYF